MDKGFHQERPRADSCRSRGHVQKSAVGATEPARGIGSDYTAMESSTSPLCGLLPSH